MIIASDDIAILVSETGAVLDVQLRRDLVDLDPLAPEAVQPPTTGETP